MWAVSLHAARCYRTMIQGVAMMRWSGWAVLVSLLVACAPGKQDPEGTPVPSGSVDPGERTVDAGVIDIPSGRAPVVDGMISPGEWDDAATVEIMVEPGWNVPIRGKHDGHARYVAFANLKPGETERYPEVLLAVRGTRDGAWTPNDWWLHASHPARTTFQFSGFASSPPIE